MTKLLKYLKGYLPEAVIAPLSKYIEAIIELIVPFFVAAMIDDGINADGKTNSLLLTLFNIEVGVGAHIDVIVWLGVIMIGLAALGIGFSLVCQYLASKAAIGFGCNVRRALYHHIHGLELSKLDGMGTGTLLGRLSNDVTATQFGLAMFLRLMLRSPFLAVGAALMCVLVAPQLWYVYLSAAAVSFAALIIIMRLSVPKFTSVQKKLDKLSSLTGETIKGERVIRAFANEEKSKEKFGKAAAAHTAAASGAAMVSCLLNPFVSVVVNIAIVIILYFGSLNMAAFGLSPGNLIAIINYMTQMMLSLIVLAVFMVNISKALTGAKRINEVFDLPAAHSGGGALPHGDEIIRMENAAYSFGGGTNAIEGLSFSLRRGETLGIIGTTGSGKSTLAGLASRFYLPTSGSVSLMGNDSASYTDEQICDIVTLAPQKALLFSGTVRSNLLWGGERTDAELVDALKAAAAYGFVRGKDGLDSTVNQKGSNFSGGEKQRLSLARALIKESPLLILDDAASALDYVTEAKVKKNIMTRSKDKAVIIISGRVGTIKNSDYILVLDGGKCVGGGKHKDLLSSCELYRKLNAQT